MKMILGGLAAVVVASAMAGAASAGEWCEYRGYDRDGRCDEYHANYHRDRFECRPRLAAAECGDFTYRDWLPRRQTYAFWSPADHSWYYWCGASSCYYPYAQVDAHPPVAGVIPRIPDGLPPVAPGGIDRPEVPQGPPPGGPGFDKGGANIPNGPPQGAPGFDKGGANIPNGPPQGAPGFDKGGANIPNGPPQGAPGFDKGGANIPNGPPQGAPGFDKGGANIPNGPPQGAPGGTDKDKEFMPPVPADDTPTHP